MQGRQRAGYPSRPGPRAGALWIGGLEHYMDEAFLHGAVTSLGEQACAQGLVGIKVMTDRSSGEPAGYGFINFDTDETAVVAMHRLGGKVIPQSAPPVRFKLNHSSTKLQPGEPDTSVWVGDLTPEVDDYALFCFFMERYGAVRYAKVVLDESGFSKGYGFVRLASEAEQRHALAGMTGAMGLGSKPIKVSMANQRSGRGPGGLARPGTWRPPPAHHRAAPVSPDPQAGRSFTGPPPTTDFSAYQQQYYQTLAAQQQQYQQAMAMAWQMQQLQLQQQVELQQQLSPTVAGIQQSVAGGQGGRGLVKVVNEELLLQ